MVSVDDGRKAKLYLLPPCDGTYAVYGAKGKGSLYVLVVEQS